MVWSWLTEKDIDRLVRDRDVDGLANLIRQKDDLAPEVLGIFLQKLSPISSPVSGISRAVVQKKRRA